MKNYPTLYTKRLILRHSTEADAHELLAYRSDPEVMRYIPRPLAQSLSDVLELLQSLDEGYDNKERITWAIALKDSNKMIGNIGYLNISAIHKRAEIGYALIKDYHRKGYMLEALERVVLHGFETMKLHSIEASIDSRNIASAAILKRVGFRQEAHFKENFFDKGEFIDSVHFGLLRSEYLG